MATALSVNPGSANVSKAEGWTLHHFNNKFAIYSYAYDVSGIEAMKVKVRVHQSKRATATDNTFKVYDPAALQAQGVPHINADNVGDWVEYDMHVRDLTPDINGVAWQSSGMAVMDIVPANEIGDLYYTYLSDYRDQLLDYYIEAIDMQGNITRTDIQQVYVGAGKYNLVDGKYLEDIDGTIEGTHPFITDQPPVPDNEKPSAPTAVSVEPLHASAIQVTWTAATDNVGVAGYEIYRDGNLIGTSPSTFYTDSGLAADTLYSYTVVALDASGNRSDLSTPATVTTPGGNNVTIYYKTGFEATYIHYRPVGAIWTIAPGIRMDDAEISGYSKITLNIGEAAQLEACFNNGTGQWDSNNMLNYFFDPGIWTYSAGQIVTGAPITQPPDTETPSVPQQVAVSSSTANSVSLTWAAATDNIAVTGYEIWRDVELVGTTDDITLSFTDSGVEASTTYSYTVVAFDAVGNRSEASETVVVTTPEGNLLTIYYRNSTFEQAYMHYRLGSSSAWTAIPGKTMQPITAYPGYFNLTVELDSADYLTAAFNNGSGQWDNNSSNNYTIAAGIWTLMDGNLMSGTPQPDSITFRVNVPGSTPLGAPIYLSGSFNGWHPNDNDYLMTLGFDGVYNLTFPLSASNSSFLYKVTRGDWSNVEVQANGNDIVNRSLTLASGQQEINITVARWKDH